MATLRGALSSAPGNGKGNRSANPRRDLLNKLNLWDRLVGPAVGAA
jgi:hypothetical protein